MKVGDVLSDIWDLLNRALEYLCVPLFLFADWYQDAPQWVQGVLLGAGWLGWFALLLVVL